MKMIAQDNDEQGTTSAHSTAISNAFFKPQTQLDVVQNNIPRKAPVLMQDNHWRSSPRVASGVATTP